MARRCFVSRAMSVEYVRMLGHDHFSCAVWHLRLHASKREPTASSTADGSFEQERTVAMLPT
eukprot:1637662-Amphidinium_carterae.1